MKAFNNYLWPLSIGAACLLTATWAYGAYLDYVAIESHNTHNDVDTCIVLHTQEDTLSYIREHIDVNDNGMPDDLENSSDTIYQIILDNQKSIDEINVHLDRINEKLDELSKSR
jgi:hypothetical protein